MRKVLLAFIVTWTGCATTGEKRVGPESSRAEPAATVVLRASPGDLLHAGPESVLLHPVTLEPLLSYRVGAHETAFGRLVPLVRSSGRRYFVRVQPHRVESRQLFANGDEPVVVVVPDDFSRASDPAKVVLRAGERAVAGSDRLIAYTRHDSSFEVPPAELVRLDRLVFHTRDDKPLGPEMESTLVWLEGVRVPERVVPKGGRGTVVPVVRSVGKNLPSILLKAQIADRSAVFADGMAELTEIRRPEEFERPIEVQILDRRVLVLVSALPLGGGTGDGGASPSDERIGRDLLVDLAHQPQPAYYFRPDRAAPGDAIQVQYLVTNRGLPVPNTDYFVAKFWASDDGNLWNGGDYLLGQKRVPGPFGSNQTFLVDWRGRVPAIPSRDYFVGLEIVPSPRLAEATTSNNWGFDSNQRLTVTQGRFPIVLPGIPRRFPHLNLGRIRIHLTRAQPRFQLPLVRPVPLTAPVRVLATLPNGRQIPLPATPVATTAGTAHSLQVSGKDLFDQAGPWVFGGAGLLAIAIVALLEDEEIGAEEATVDPGEGGEKVRKMATPENYTNLRGRARLWNDAGSGLPGRGDERMLPGVLRVRLDAMLPDNAFPSEGEYHGFRVLRSEGDAAWFRQTVFIESDDKGVLRIRAQEHGCAPLEATRSEWNGSSLIGRTDRLPGSVEGCYASLTQEGDEAVLEMRASVGIPVLTQSFDAHLTLRLRREAHAIAWQVEGTFDGLEIEVHVGTDRVFRRESGGGVEVLASPMEGEIPRAKGVFEIP